MHGKILNDIQDAMLFVSAAGYGVNSAILERSSGKIYYRTDIGDLNEFDENEFDPAVHIAIPHKNDLDLGKNIVFDFVEKHIPEIHEKVDRIFRKRGAYSRYKDLLETKGCLQEWYDYENQMMQQAILQWCKQNAIDVNC